MIDDDHRDLLAQPVEGFEQLLGDGGRKPLERLVEQKHPHVAGERARDGDHLLLAARQIVGRRVASAAPSRGKNCDDSLVAPNESRRRSVA